MIIYGAGMAGLLAAGMLRRFSPYVQEAQESLPDNHGALLRFRSEVVAQATGQPFQKVRVLKAVKYKGSLHHRADLRMSNLYSWKVSGQVATRSILDTNPVDRYIAPPDFIPTMAAGARIVYGAPLTREGLEDHRDRGEPVISTIPMNILMDIVGWEERPEFLYRGITSYRFRIHSPATDVYQTIYYPDPEDRPYRASITGDLLTVECMGDTEEDAFPDISAILADFGIIARSGSRVDRKSQPYGKLLPIQEKVRRAFILAMTDQFRVYSVGRFATWRQILMDDVVHDVELVSRFISERDTYTRELHFNRRY